MVGTATSNVILQEVKLVRKYYYNDLPQINMFQYSNTQFAYTFKFAYAQINQL